MVEKALENDFWVAQLYTQGGLSVEHIEKFYKLWDMLQNVHLDIEVKDSISWKFGKDGSYLASSAYKMQMFGTHLLYDAFYGVEVLAPSQVQDLHMVGSPKPGLDGG